MNNPWEQIERPLKDVNARRVDYKHPLNFFWAIDSINNYLFIYKFKTTDPLESKIPQLKGIKCVLSKISGNNYQLVLILKEKVNWDMFYALCMDLFTVSVKEQDALDAWELILRRLQRWQEFLKRDRERILTEEKIKGLVGELHFIHKHIGPTHGFYNAIKFWTGPLGQPQDFNIGDDAIEVKCQIGTSAPKVRISSIEQLCSQVQTLYLFVVTLGKTSDTDIERINLPILVERIIQQLEKDNCKGIELFMDLLAETGYFYAKAYDDYNYILSTNKTYEVKDDFPRLDPGEIPIGVSSIKYDISLQECINFECIYPKTKEIL